MKRTLLAALLVLGLASPGLAEENFPQPSGLGPAVQFWTRVYTEVGVDGGFIHDSRQMDVVYEVIEVPTGVSRRQRQKHTDRAKGRYQKILGTLAGGKRKNLSSEEARVLALWPSGVSNRTLRDARSRIRFQLGQANKFRAGLIRSGAYKDRIIQELRDEGVPIELAALPHVESSYTPYAYSHVGAAGLWQFTRSTGRRFMRVDHVVDERLDPHRATVAAAQLLKQNFQVTGSWPLAVTAYNHGASGMRRAKRKLGTSNIATIVAKYKSRTFGFASRNFYTEFLAAKHVDANAERYFGTLPMDSPIDYARAASPSYVPAPAMAKALGIKRSVLKAQNPALLAPVWDGSKRIPRDFVIQVPRSLLSRPIKSALASINASQRYASQTRDRTHKVRRGETLSQIAARYGLSIRQLADLNGLRNRNRIRIGQKLSLPVDGKSRPAREVAAIAPPSDGIYVVRRGDSLSKIGRRFGMSPNELAKLNRLKNRNKLVVGQRLVVSRDAAKPPTVVAVAETPAAVAPQAKTVVQAAKEPAPERPDEPMEIASVPLQAPATQPVPAVPATLPPASAEAGPAAGIDEGADIETTGLVADPSDYAVDGNDKIEVQATETLGHYGDWLGIKTNRLRDINGLRYGKPIAVGKQLKLDFRRVTREAFEARRLAYHRDLQATFFEQYELTGTRDYVTRSGDSLWSLAQREFKIPVWLLRQYNPDVDFGALHARTKLSVPTIRQHGLRAS